MSEDRNRYRNPPAPSGMKMPVSPTRQTDQHPARPGMTILSIPVADRNPDAPVGLYTYEDEPNNTQLYFDYLDITIDLGVLFEDIDLNLAADDTDFSIESSEEGELNSNDNESTASRTYDLKKVKIEKEDSDLQTLPSPKKEKLKRRVSETDISSDSEETLSYYEYKKRYKQKKRSRSSSRSRASRTSAGRCSAEDIKVSIKLEEIEQPQHLFGSYPCELCNIKMTSQQTWESHVSGKRHMKAEKAKNLADTVMKTIPRNEASTKYPLPPSGIKRLKSKEKAKIQDVVAEELDTPCPALHKVIEIQGIKETRYYCKLCDSPCDCNCIVSHLRGYKHRLHCLKYLCPDIYERNNYNEKHKFERDLNNILFKIQKDDGMGKMSVEIEIPADGDGSYLSERQYRDQPSTSSLNDPRSSSYQNYHEEDCRDYSKSGFYCKVCQSHMNSEGMWQSHISGKRHLANLKKQPGSVPSKLKSIPMPNQPSYLLTHLLKDEYEPVVGLDNIIEIQNHESRLEKYQCLLCCASFTRVDIRDHLVSDKHRRNYLQQIRHDQYMLSLDVTGANTHNTVAEFCYEVECELGRGHPEVRVIKDSLMQ